MGWALNVQLVEGCTAAELAAELGGRLDEGSTADGLTALSAHDGPAWIGEVHGWGVVCDPAFAHSQQDHLELSRGRRVLALLLHTTATVYGVSWYVDGATVRRAVYVEGEVAESAGEPLPQERVPDPPHAEDWAPAVMRGLTGVGLRELVAARYTRLS
jgi:hypothetical protein